MIPTRGEQKDGGPSLSPDDFHHGDDVFRRDIARHVVGGCEDVAAVAPRLQEPPSLFPHLGGGSKGQGPLNAQATVESQNSAPPPQFPETSMTSG